MSDVVPLESVTDTSDKPEPCKVILPVIEPVGAVPFLIVEIIADNVVATWSDDTVTATGVPEGETLYVVIGDVNATVTAPEIY